jgi:hypothetical protein
VEATDPQGGTATGFCPGCGTALAADHAFCPRCGRQRTAPGEEPPRCPGCGAVARADDAFCARCGRVLRPAVDAIPHRPSGPPPVTPARAIVGAGASLVVVGAGFFLALAIARGWLTRELQVVLALIGGLALVAAGGAIALRARDRRGLRIAGEVVAGAGAGIAMLGLVAGAAVYEPAIVDLRLALALAALVVAAVTAIALRTGAQLLAAYALGILILSPALLDAEATTGLLLFVVVSLAATAAIGAVRDWPWLTPVAAATSAPQVIAYLQDRLAGDAVDAAMIGWALVLPAWWALIASAALLRPLLHPPARLEAGPAIGTIAAALAAALATAASLDRGPLEEIGTPVLGGIALAHVAIAARLHRGGARDLALVALTATAILAAIATLFSTDGAGLVAVLAIGSAALLVAGARTGSPLPLPIGAVLAGVGTLRAVSLLPPWANDPTTREVVEGGLAVLALVVAAIAVERLAGAVRWRPAVRVAIAALALYGLSFAVAAPLVRWALGGGDQAEQVAQVAISVAWAGLGLGLIVVALARDRRALRFVGIGLLAATAAKALIVDTAALDAGLRVGAFVASGLLLLVGGLLLARGEGRSGRTTPGQDT